MSNSNNAVSVADKIDKLVSMVVESNFVTLMHHGMARRTKQDDKIVYEASELYSNKDEFFDGWLPLTMNTKRTFEFNSSQLRTIRDASRVICSTNEIMGNAQKHYRNFVIGDSLITYILPADPIEDPAEIEKFMRQPTVKRLYGNWREFWSINKMHLRMFNWEERVHRDGEAFLRLFSQNRKKAPLVRFIDPAYIDGGDGEHFGINLANDGDLESIQSYNYIDPDTGKTSKIPADRVIHDKRNVDFESPRGIPSGWPIFSNLRRVEKLLINTSILSAIHSAIAFVRTFDGASQARVQALMKRESDGKVHTSTITGRDINAKAVAPGTILNASTGMKYEFPAHNVDPSRWIEVMKHEIRHIAAGRVLPVSWLLTEEPTEPLTPGSPVIANFRSERRYIYEHVIDLFWRVQDLMGENVDNLKQKYEVQFNGPRLAVGKSLDEARVDDLNLKNGATSPQSIAAKNGENYVVNRAQTIAHRKSAMPGETMPGDSGNANPQGSGSGDNGGDGLSKKNGGQRGSDASGGNNNV